MKFGFTQIVIVGLVTYFSCSPKNPVNEIENEVKKGTEKFFIVPGEDEEIEKSQINKGEVLVAYSDCYQCHREETKAKGPSFSDIARRYPMNQTYIDLLARKVIAGGSGTWGYPVMSPHPKLSLEDAKIMVTYILSLEKSKS